jgi:outer membrane protein OmpA-like peptidoglycan-associated protein
MKKWTFILFATVFTVVCAQDTKYEVAVIGFYNLENLFDMEESMQTINVDKLNQGEANYIFAEDYDSDKYYAAAWNHLYENVRISKSKTDFSQLPKIPVRALEFSKATVESYEERTGKKITKQKLKALVEKDDTWLSKSEFRTLVKENEFVELPDADVMSKINDAENTPTGARQYTEEVYNDKLSKLASVIKQLGIEYSADGAALIGLAEIENTKVLDALVNNKSIRDKGYKVLQYDCMYSRGVDVALLYQEKYFEIIETHSLQVPIFNDKAQTVRYYTRDILWVEGKLLGETVHILVNHWPSRSGGEAKSSKNREIGAQACQDVIAKLMAEDPNTQIIVMGDFNDDPNNKSVQEIVGAAKNVEDVKQGGMYNPLFKDFKKGYGSLSYRGSWNLFDQILISSSFVDDITNTWKLQDAEVAYNQDWISRFGGYEGGPNRSFGGNYYQGGYSDHLPSLIYLKRVALDDIDKDGITDKDDKCPELPGLKAFNGCPDSDEDGIEDSKDSCPEEKGELANNGCPWLDSDGDSVLDKDDKCPETKGLVENQGCPELKEAIKAVFENLVFDTDKFTIQKSSDDELIALADLLKNNPELLINISGHTDNVSDDIRNMDLSKNRAYAVKDRLASLGIAPKRMEVLYFGETQPIESNDTETGRQANRRVVFEVRSK